ncbi:MAG: GNAT family N-acetyltransferase [Solirubrobacterales bacterium]
MTAVIDIRAAAEQAATVSRAAPADVSNVAQTLGRAFHVDPVFTWLLAEDPGHLRILTRYFELFLNKVWIEQQETYTTVDSVAAAVWCLPRQWHIGVRTLLGLAPASVGVFGRHLPRVLRALAMVESKHPRLPHYYLAFVGVDPQWQGRGLGTAVLAPVLERCDREAMPAYLEASTPRSRALYERHGFAVTEELTFAKNAPPVWRMWREPRGG